MPSLGAYYNVKFVNFKVDAEVGEGIALAKQFGVKGYPTFIYTDADGEAFFNDNSMGYDGVDGLLTLGKIALGEEAPKDLAWYEAEYVAGNRDLAFLHELGTVRLREKSMAWSDQLKLDIFLATPESERCRKGSDTYDLVIWNATPGNRFYEELVARRDTDFVEFLGDRVEVVKMISNRLTRAHYSDQTGSTHLEISKRYKEDFAEHYAAAAEISEIDKLRVARDAEEYVPSYFDWVEKWNMPADFGPGIAGEVARQEDPNPEHARFAIQSLRMGVEADPPYFISVGKTGYLMYKAGDQAGAFAFAQRFKSVTSQYDGNRKTAWEWAIMKALEEGQDPTDAAMGRVKPTKSAIVRGKPVKNGVVQWHMEIPAGVGPGSEFELTIVAEMDPSWHIYQLFDTGSQNPTLIDVYLPQGVSWTGEWNSPTPNYLGDAPGHSGVARFRRSLRFGEVEAADVSIGARVSFQACDPSRCLPPTEVELKLSMKPEETRSSKGR